MSPSTTTVTLGGRGMTGALLLLIGAALLALVGFGLVPALHTRAAAMNEIILLQANIAKLQTPLPEGPLAARAAREENIQRALQAERERLMGRVWTFRDAQALGEVLPAARSGRIDFKVALYNARARLEEKAKARGVSIPPDLGMPEALETEQRTDQRLWQLASVVVLMDRCLDLGVPEIRSVRALDPLEIPLDEAPDGARMVVFPVEISFTATDAVWRSVLRAFRDTEPFFSLRHVAMESVSLMRPDQLMVRATFGALLRRTGPPPPPEGTEGNGSNAPGAGDRMPVPPGGTP